MAFRTYAGPGYVLERPSPILNCKVGGGIALSAQTWCDETFARGESFFPSNARWLSPGRLSSRKDNCILQINRIKAAATSVVTTMCIQKRTELGKYTIHWLTPCRSKMATKQTQRTKQNKTTKNKATPTSQKRARSVIS